MQEKLTLKALSTLIKRIWNDPVLSKVISVAIIGMFVVLWTILDIRLNIFHLSALLIGLTVLFLLWILCFILYFEKKSVGETFGVPARFPAYPKRIRRAALTGVFVIPMLAVSALFIQSYYESVPAKKIIILVGDFDGPDPQNYRVTQNIYEALGKAVEGYPDLQVQLLGEPISFKQGSNFARSKGKEEKASIVLWGSYGKSGESVQMTVNFEVLETPAYFSSIVQTLSSRCGHETLSKSFTYPVEELNRFSLQIEISHQLSALTFLTTGIALYKVGDYDASINYFNQALVEWGKPGPMIEVADIYFWRADAYLAKGELNRAISDLGIVIHFQPGNGSAYNNRGNAYTDTEDPDRAIADYTKAIELASGDCLPCAYSNRGHLYEDKGAYDMAVADLNEAIRLKPDFADAYDARGHAYVHKKEYDKAIADHNSAINLDPKIPCFFNNLGHAHAENKEYDKAIADYDHAIKLLPSKALFFLNRGDVFVGKGEYDKAIADYDHAIKLESDYSEAYHQRGHAHLKSGDADNAIVDFSEAIKLAPNKSGFYWDRAPLYEDKGDATKALADYDRIIQIDQEDAGAYHRRGRIHADNGDLNKAIADYTKAIQYQVDHATAYFDRGKAYANKRAYNNAITDFSLALKLDSHDSEAYHQRGHAYLNRGDADKAIADFSEAMRLDPKAAGIHLDRGDGYALIRDYENAVADYKKTIDLTDDPDIRGTAIERLKVMAVKQHRPRMLRKAY